MRKKKLIFSAMAFLLAMVMFTTTASASILFRDDSGSASTPGSSVYAYSGIKKNIEEYAAVNSEVVGWLIVPNTNINVPITLSKQDNNYYMYRDWKGQYYSGITATNYTDTATYLDFRTSLGTGWRNGTSKNLVLYGHNWNNLRAPFKIGNQAGLSMFAQLPSYTSQEFTKNNPHIYFSTGEMEGVWRVFAVAYSELSADFFYNNPNPTTEAYQTLLNEWRERSIWNMDVDVTTDDRIITLSTCTRVYGNYSEGGVGDQQRFVVVARLLRDGESENDAVNFTVNQNVKQPKF